MTRPPLAEQHDSPARPITPEPRAGRGRRGAKRALGSMLGPLAGLAGAIDRAAHAGRSQYPGELWPFADGPERALLVRLDLLGDCLLTLPLAAALKRRYPSLAITFLVARGSGPLVGLCRYVDEVIECDLASLPHLAGLSDPHGWCAAAALLADLRRRNFDLAVAAYGPLARAVVSLAGARRRIADGPAALGIDCHRRRRAGEHEIDHLCRLIEADPADVPADLITSPMPAPLPVSPKGLVVLCPGARSGSAKAWPLRHWQALVAGLVAAGRKVAISGLAGEQPLAAAIAGGNGAVVDLCGKLSIGQLAVLLAKSAVVVTVDSMPLHLADLQGTRVVALFGPTEPGQYGPRGQRSLALSSGITCSPCYVQRAPPSCPFGDQLCMEWIEPDMVLAAVLDQ